MRRARRKPSLGPANLELGAVSKPPTIDVLDRELIAALQENGREAFRRIAARLGVSEGTIRHRYARLVSANVLQVTAITNPLGLGFEAMAIIAINTDASTSAIADELATWKEASYVVVTAGQFDLIVELVCVNRAHLLERINAIRELEGVVSTETFVYLQLCKQLYNWGTATNGESEAAPASAEGLSR